jgi:F-type H+-transporting ATPase subunit delta
LTASRTDSLAIASRYATAMFDLAVDAKKEATLVEEMSQLAKAMRENEALATALSNPLLSRETKGEVLAKIAAAADVLTKQSLATLSAQGRADILPYVAELLEAKLAKHRDTLVAEVTSARPLNKAMEKQIRDALEKATGKDVQLSLKENPEVLGGVSIRLGSYLLDATLSGALNNIRAQLLAPQYS